MLYIFHFEFINQNRLVARNSSKLSAVSALKKPKIICSFLLNIIFWKDNVYLSDIYMYIVCTYIEQKLFQHALHPEFFFYFVQCGVLWFKT